LNSDPALPEGISETVRLALAEDIGPGDLTAELVPAKAIAHGRVTAREAGVLCGVPWFTEVYSQIDKTVSVEWMLQDGDRIEPEKTVCTVTGPARAVLSGERTALNLIQTLSGTATITDEYVALLQGLHTKLLDTRKTVPGLRTAQKYAVLCGGGKNHRRGLYDAILIKENHIAAAGGISAALKQARKARVPVEIEVESLEELEEALSAGAKRILLDNFDMKDLSRAVSLNDGQASLEASGDIDRTNIRSFAETGVDYISIGALTKHIHAIDFSMRFTLV